MAEYVVVLGVITPGVVVLFAVLGNPLVEKLWEIVGFFS